MQWSLLLSLLVTMQGNLSSDAQWEKATFAGGCFWCMEATFQELEGVAEVISGYTGGHTVNPTYEDVCSGTTGHLEAIQVIYDSSRVTYAELLDVFWKRIDPTDPGGQFCDRGSQYGTVIFYHSDEQRRLAIESEQRLEKSGKFDRPIVTEVREATEFYRAEDHHQDYYKTCSVQYESYEKGSGRNRFLERVWGTESDTAYLQDTRQKWDKPSDEELREILTPLQYTVTQENGTERAFENEHWNNRQAGLYVDIVSGVPLFSSLDKFESGTGWPSFTKPLESGNIVEKEDRSSSVPRTEVRSKHADSHLGHVFPDGPPPSGMRYCVNSAALRFIPVEALEKWGYGEYRKLFED